MSLFSADNLHAITTHPQPLTRIKISGGLTEFPRQVFDHADTLEILDLGNNQLSDLPDDFAQLYQLKILFLTNNHFTHIPPVLAQCPKLEMIAFKENQLSEFGENSIPEHTRWLILTGNRLTRLPDSMGRLKRLQKLALAGNQLTQLPDSMADCHSLELVRLSANNLTHLPDWLFQLPRLAWLGFAGNPFSSSVFTGVDHHHPDNNQNVPLVSLDDIELGEKLGEGASGSIYRGHWQQPHPVLGKPDIAVKLFKGEVTSDGYPQDELDCCLDAGHHPHIVKTIGEINGDTDTQKGESQKNRDQKGIVMELIPAGFSNLGNPPDFDSCTRDTFAPSSQLSADEIHTIVSALASAAAHLHQQGVSHGDLYAHNTLIKPASDFDDNAPENTSGNISEKTSVLISDFGAASDSKTLSDSQRVLMEKIEVRAWGYLLDDLLNLPDNEKDRSTELIAQLSRLRDACLQSKVLSRPDFAEIVSRCAAI